MIDWTSITITSPLILRNISIALFRSIVRDKKNPEWDFLHFPYDTQADERCAKLVTEASIKSGFKWIDAKNSKQNVTKVFLIICISDAPDRATIQNFIQYNGKYGCGFCQQSGERVEKGKRFCRIYPVQQPLPEIRSFEQCVDFAEETSLTGKAVHGVKGPTELMKLYPNFCLVQSFVPDYMHAVLLGALREIMSPWIQTSSNDFSINQKSLSVLNHRMLNIKCPQETTRKLRLTNDFLFWKASGFRVFLFVSPIILKNLISKNVYNHWLLLVLGISLLLGNQVTTNDLEEAEFALQKFVYGVRDIYGIQEQTYNIHFLLQLRQAIKSWGPLWAHSCFIYEDAVGQFKQFHHGTRGKASQLLSSFVM
ncbi:hypothetical protein AVEN_135801-1 [Araneus ventricosus]|uniref:Uncharacterized protein n=1 Tax=Araneus ventricosus TaxID=182803 RepID=A0A4Y2TMY0_ARAVE|nr:hypothetical protein AVEN_135801-1 [Araneus ventricosus]